MWVGERKRSEVNRCSNENLHDDAALGVVLLPSGIGWSQKVFARDEENSGPKSLHSFLIFVE